MTIMLKRIWGRLDSTGIEKQGLQVKEHVPCKNMHFLIITGNEPVANAA